MINSLPAATSSIAAESVQGLVAIAHAMPGGSEMLTQPLEKGARTVWSQWAGVNWFETILTLGATAVIFVLSASKSKTTKL